MRAVADLSPETRDAVRDGCKRSAAIVLPLVFDFLGKPDALLDVGAGEGWWSLAALDLGVEEVTAVDLSLPTAMDEAAAAGRRDGRFADLVSVGQWDAESSMGLPPYALDARYGLALCLEMAEHVSPQAGDHLVSELCRVADAVLWSAAIPGQGGDGHVNEQWPDYWQERFLGQGWRLTDPFRDDLWMHPDVDPWYRSNTLLAVPIPLNPRGMIVTVAPHPLVDPATWAHYRGVPAPSA